MNDRSGLRTLGTVFVLAVLVTVGGPRRSAAQNEGSIEIRARVLPSSAVGVTQDQGAGAQVATGPQAAQPEGGGGDAGITDGVDTGQTPEPDQGAPQRDGPSEEGDQDVGPTEEGEEEVVGGDAPPTGPRTQVMSIRADNSVLVEVQRDQAILSRMFLEFGTGGDDVGQVDVGTLEEDTTVDIFHMSI